MLRVTDISLRFSSKVLESPNGCHLWCSTIKRDGYGQFWIRGRGEKAHRAAYQIFVGEIPAGLGVLHKCGNRRCVNPEHLYAGTAKQNSSDMVIHGRAGKRRRLTDEQVEFAISALAEGQSQLSVARSLNVDQTTVSRIHRRHQNYVRRIRKD